MVAVEEAIGFETNAIERSPSLELVKENQKQAFLQDKNAQSISLR